MDLVDALNREHVRPLLRGEGFRARGLDYSFSKGANIAVINIQRGHSGRRMTMNGGVYSGRLGKSLSSPPSVWNCHYQVRVGRLVAPPRDLWWELAEPETLAAIGKDVRDKLDGLLVPDLLMHLTDESLRDHWLRRWREGKASFLELTYLAQLVDKLGPPQVRPLLESILSKGPGTSAGPDNELARVLDEMGYTIVGVAGEDRERS
jgi:hypothetical protein